MSVKERTLTFRVLQVSQATAARGRRLRFKVPLPVSRA
jgi:hypothetical protein